MQKAEQISQTVAQGGGALALLSGTSTWLTENHDLIASLGVLVGIAVGVIGLGFNIYFGHRRVQILKGRVK